MKKRTSILILLVTAGFIAAPILAREAGLRINITESAPVGLWMVGGESHVERGRLVSICPPAVPVVKAMAAARPLYRGDCKESWMIPLLKPIAAIPGDTVTIRRDGNAAVNGRGIPNTSANAVLAWPAGTYAVAPGQVWVFSTYSADSFDSRYFGPVDTANILGTARPIMVYGSTSNMIRGFR